MGEKRGEERDRIAAVHPQGQMSFSLKEMASLNSHCSLAGVISFLLVKSLRHGGGFRANERPHSRDGELGSNSGLPMGGRLLSLGKSGLLVQVIHSAVHLTESVQLGGLGSLILTMSHAGNLLQHSVLDGCRNSPFLGLQAFHGVPTTIDRQIYSFITHLSS